MWKLTLTKGQKSIGCKRIFKTKLNTDGSVKRYKARLVTNEYNKYLKVTFAPVGKYTELH